MRLEVKEAGVWCVWASSKTVCCGVVLWGATLRARWWRWQTYADTTQEMA